MPPDYAWKNGPSAEEQLRERVEELEKALRNWLQHSPAQLRGETTAMAASYAAARNHAVGVMVNSGLV